MTEIPQRSHKRRVDPFDIFLGRIRNNLIKIGVAGASLVTVTVLVLSIM